MLLLPLSRIFFIFAFLLLIALSTSGKIYKKVNPVKLGSGSSLKKIIKGMIWNGKESDTAWIEEIKEKIQSYISDGNLIPDEPPKVDPARFTQFMAILRHSLLLYAINYGHNNRKEQLAKDLATNLKLTFAMLTYYQKKHLPDQMPKTILEFPKAAGDYFRLICHESQAGAFKSIDYLLDRISKISTIDKVYTPKEIAPGNEQKWLDWVKSFVEERYKSIKIAGYSVQFIDEILNYDRKLVDKAEYEKDFDTPEKQRTFFLAFFSWKTLMDLVDTEGPFYMIKNEVDFYTKDFETGSGEHTREEEVLTEIFARYLLKTGEFRKHCATDTDEKFVKNFNDATKFKFKFDLTLFRQISIKQLGCKDTSGPYDIHVVTDNDIESHYYREPFEKGRILHEVLEHSLEPYQGYDLKPMEQKKIIVSFYYTAFAAFQEHYNLTRHVRFELLRRKGFDEEPPKVDLSDPVTTKPGKIPDRKRVEGTSGISQKHIYWALSGIAFILIGAIGVGSLQYVFKWPYPFPFFRSTDPDDDDNHESVPLPVEDNNKTLYTCSVVMIILLFGAGYYLYMKRRRKDMKDNPPIDSRRISGYTRRFVDPKMTQQSSRVPQRSQIFGTPQRSQIASQVFQEPRMFQQVLTTSRISGVSQVYQDPRMSQISSQAMSTPQISGVQRTFQMEPTSRVQFDPRRR